MTSTSPGFHSGTHRRYDGRRSPGTPLVPQAHRKPRIVPVTVIVPAYNEGATLGDTLISLLTQTVAPAEIIVVDDCSTDDTADVAARLGVRVLRPPANTGSKAGAQSFALGHVKTAFVMAIDADTTLAPQAIERLLP